MKTIYFEDKGQDCLWWKIQDDGLIVEAGPFQNSVWSGRRVHPETVQVGSAPVFVDDRGGSKRSMLYQIDGISAA